MTFRTLLIIFSFLFILPVNGQGHKQSEAYLVTAATGAIGSAICHYLAARGHDLVIAGRSQDKLDMLSGDLQKTNSSVKLTSLQVDFSNVEQLAKNIKETPLPAIKGIVLIGPRPYLSRDNIPGPEEWQQTFLETFIAPLEALRLLAPGLQDSGSIVVMSGSTSKDYLSSYPNTNVVRVAWNAEIKNLVHYFAPQKIRVNAISPGPIMTKHHEVKIAKQAELNKHSFEEQYKENTASIPLGSYGSLEDVAQLTYFLLSKNSGHVNGTNILLDGGASNSY